MNEQENDWEMEKKSSARRERHRDDDGGTEQKLVEVGGRMANEFYPTFLYIFSFFFFSFCIQTHCGNALEMRFT